jgi:hypothetical protein
MLLWQQNAGKAAATSAAQGVPEPSAAAVATLAWAALSVSTRRRRQG